jgi:hypothetical protein
MTIVVVVPAVSIRMLVAVGLLTCCIPAAGSRAVATVALISRPATRCGGVLDFKDS